jgi:transcriptional regulator with XRE-family HTH domain
MKPTDLRDTRTALGFTQQQFADALGMHANTVACMERGEKPISPRTVAAVEMLARLMRHTPAP